MNINELFSKPVNWSYTHSDSNGISAMFTIKNKIFNVNFLVWDYPIELTTPPMEITDIVEVEFTEEDKNENKAGITNRGDAIVVFSTVLDIINKTVEKYYIETLFFSASEPSRIKLYTRMLKKLGSDNWTIISNEVLKKNQLSMRDTHSFVLIKKQ